MAAVAKRRRGKLAFAVAGSVFLLYNANGREIGSIDSQPAKYTALELALHRTFILDNVIGYAPGLQGRAAFARCLDGHYRSAYSVAPSVIAGGVALALRAIHVVDLRAPLAASLVAKITASALTALAVLLAFLAAERRVSPGTAALIALGFGLGTNLWAVVSQTLWQHETTIFGLMAAVDCLAVPAAELTAARRWGAGACLGLAGAARPQVAPAIAMLALSVALRRHRWADFLALIPLFGAAAGCIALNVCWFGHALGATPQLEALHPSVHAVTGTFTGTALGGAAGLLVSPSRGLLVFSPVVLFAFSALAQAGREGWRSDLPWCAMAAVAQFALYANYSVWWGGHTYGPRYCLDLLPMLVPLIAAGAAPMRQVTRFAGAAALGWSVLLAGTGAFCYPAEQWNTNPVSVDQHHERLWNWHDPQFVRCWSRGMSPQNFRLFHRQGRARELRM